MSPWLACSPPPGILSCGLISPGSATAQAEPTVSNRTRRPWLTLRRRLTGLSETRGIKTAVLLGLCSGADIALKYGHTDDRIVALVLLDPTIPPTWKFYLNYLGQRATNMRSWQTFLGGRGRIWGDLIIRMIAATGVPLIGAQSRLIDPQSRRDLEARFKHSLERKLRLLIVFTGGMAEYREQLLDAFPSLDFGNMLTLEYLDDSDHIFTSVKHRERLNQLVLTSLQDMRRAERTGDLPVCGRQLIEAGLVPDGQPRPCRKPSPNAISRSSVRPLRARREQVFPYGGGEASGPFTLCS